MVNLVPFPPPRLRRASRTILWILFLSAVTVLAPNATWAQQAAPSTRIEFLKYGSKATTVAQSPEGRYVAIGARDVPGGGSRVVLWNRVRQERVRTETFSANHAPQVAFDSTESRLAVASRSGGVTIWHLDGPQTITPRRTGGIARSIAFGRQGVLGTGTQGTLQVWAEGLDDPPATLNTDGSVKSLAFSPITPEVILTNGDTQATLWNYRFDTTKRIDTFERCPGLLRQVEMPDRPTYIYVITRRRAECDPDYLCTIRTEDRSVIDRFRRKNISTVEHLGGARVAYGRGRYVYTLNLESREERIVYTSENAVQDLAYANGRLVVANSDVVILNL